MLGYYVGSSVRVALGFGSVLAFHDCYPLPEIPVAQSLSSARQAAARSCAITPLQASGAQCVSLLKCNHVHETHEQAATGSRRGPRKQKSCFVTGTEKR